MNLNKVIGLSAMSFLGPDIDYYHIHGHRDMIRKLLFPIRKSKVVLPAEIHPKILKKKTKDKRYQAFFKYMCPINQLHLQQAFSRFTNGNQLNKDLLKEVQGLRILFDDEFMVIEKDDKEPRKKLFDLVHKHEDIFSSKALLAADIANGVMLARVLLSNESINKDIANQYFEYFENKANDLFTDFDDFATHASIGKKFQMAYIEYKYKHPLYETRELSTAMFGIYPFLDW